MLKDKNQRTIFAIWLGWVAVTFAYQAFVTARIDIGRPDYALQWTPTETLADSNEGKKFLLEPMLNEHVAWDSEYYLAIAVDGYESDDIGRLPSRLENVSSGGGFWPFTIPENAGSVVKGLSKNYAFFPLYPQFMRLVSVPLGVFGLNEVATAALAGVIVSTLGTLAAMLALYDLGKDELGGEGGIRAALYLVIFPSGFFLAQVYTEGLFLGLAFSSLALLRRGHFWQAALLAALATFTRAVGVVLSVPLLMYWFSQGDWRDLDLEWRQLYFNGIPWKGIGKMCLAFTPAFAFFLWRISFYGMAFARVEEEFFGRGLLSLGYTFFAWRDSILQVFGDNPQAAAYYLLEWSGVLLGFTACIAGFKRHPDLAAFGFLAILLSFTSGPAQGMHRYILAAPSVFLLLSRKGANPVFDRIWSFASILLFAILITMFSFDLWTG